MNYQYHDVNRNVLIDNVAPKRAWQRRFVKTLIESEVSFGGILHSEDFLLWSGYVGDDYYEVQLVKDGRIYRYTIWLNMRIVQTNTSNYLCPLIEEIKHFLEPIISEEG